MKIVIRLFFRTLRIILIPFMLLWEIISTPKGIVRTAGEQQRIDAQTRNMVLYQYKTCPFCIKARKEIARLSLKIEQRDAQHDQQNRAELQQGGGAVKVPCLRITDAEGNVQWMYESGKIITYLNQHYAPTQQSA